MPETLVDWAQDSGTKEQTDLSEIQLVTHYNCLDGATCGVLGVAANMTPAFVYPDGALAYLQALNPKTPVVLADVSFPPGAYDSVAPRLVQLIDHHQTALPLRGLPRVRIEMEHCGSTLLYRWLTETGHLSRDAAWEPLLAAVDDYDLWRPEHKVGQDLNRLFHDLGWEWYRNKYRQGWTELTEAEADRLRVLVTEEEAFVHRHVSERTETFQAGSHPMALVVLDGEGAVNEIAHQLLQQGAHGVLMLKLDGRLSIRSTQALDAARLMEEGFSGGGHPRAAGGRLPASVANDKEAPAFIMRQTDEVVRRTGL